jgi:hypothetical protein
MLGKYDIEIRYEPEMDGREFGSSLSGNFNALYKFKINESGNWDADFQMDFIQSERAWEYPYWYGSTSIAGARIKLTLDHKSENDIIERNLRIDQTLHDVRHVRKLDFTFSHHFIGSGQW